MRQKDALRAAAQFVRNHYREYEAYDIDIALEHDGQRRRSWSFGVRPPYNEEGSERLPGPSLVGYVHADGKVEGLY